MSSTQQIVNLSFKHYREGLIPGPQVPPRNPQETSPGSHGDRVLSVSGKKRCSHCKEELGKNIFCLGIVFLITGTYFNEVISFSGDKNSYQSY